MEFEAAESVTTGADSSSVMVSVPLASENVTSVSLILESVRVAVSLPS